MKTYTDSELLQAAQELRACNMLEMRFDSPRHWRAQLDILGSTDLELLHQISDRVVGHPGPLVVQPTPEDPLPGDARVLLRVIAHEWLRDIAYTVDNVNRVVKFLEVAFLNFDAHRAEHLRFLSEEVIQMNNLLIRPASLGAPLDGEDRCSDLHECDPSGHLEPRGYPLPNHEH